MLQLQTILRADGRASSGGAASASRAESEQGSEEGGREHKKTIHFVACVGCEDTRTALRHLAGRLEPALSPADAALLLAYNTLSLGDSG